MTDIVERLRNPARDNRPLLTLREAADEIERLRRWKRDVEARTEDATEYVLAQINKDQVAEIERLRKKIEEYESLEEFRAECEFRD